MVGCARRLAAVGAVLLVSVGSASAANLTWSLSHVQFNDGGSAIGSFTFDSETKVVSNWSITVSPWTYDGSGSSGVVQSPAFSYGNAIGDGAAFFTQEDPYGFITLRDNSQFYDNNPNNTREIRLSFVSALDTPGATVAINLNSGFGAECWNCAPARLFSAGSVTAVPEPSRGAMLLFGGLLLGATAMRRARVL